MTAAERKVRERYPDGSAECSRNVLAAFNDSHFAVRVRINGFSVAIGWGNTKPKAWRDAALRLPPAPASTEQEP